MEWIDTLVKMVLDMTTRTPGVAAANPTVRKINLHMGMNDVVKQQSEMLKQDFTDLLNTVGCLDVKILISAPLPSVRGGAERFSRSVGLNTWLSKACDVHSMHFLENFNWDWDCRHLFKQDGLFLNRSGVKFHVQGFFLPGSPICSPH